MKLPRLILISTLFLLTIFTLTTRAATQWTKDDHEIFELQSALEASEGKTATFYSVLNIRPTSNLAEIKRAYRKRSLEWHPDKNSGVKGAQQRFERLGLVYKILRDERKDRYDHFLKAGFPKWRKDGYFYERYRPGLGAVVVGVVLLSMLVEVGVSRLTSGQERRKIERLKMSARLVAWGPRYQAILASLLYPTVPGMSPSKTALVEKKVRVPITGFPNLPLFPTTPNADWDVQESLARTTLSSATTDGAPIVDCLVHKEDVLLHDKFTGEWVRLDENDAQPSGVWQTWPVRLGQALVNRVTGAHEDVLGEVDEEEEKEEVGKKAKRGGKKKNK